MAFTSAALAAAAGVGGHGAPPSDGSGRERRARNRSKDATPTAAGCLGALHGGGDPMSAQYCAFALPVVMQWLGAAHWEELRPAFVALCAHTDVVVRRISATSLHEIARVLGRSLSCDAVDEQVRCSFLLFASLLLSFSSFSLFASLRRRRADHFALHDVRVPSPVARARAAPPPATARSPTRPSAPPAPPPLSLARPPSRARTSRAPDFCKTTPRCNWAC
jgi:hypothetical protein